MSLENFIQRQKELLFRFRNRINNRLDNSHCRIEQFAFHSVVPDGEGNGINSHLKLDSEIDENRCFAYDVFVPAKRKDQQSAILLLHGLNERSWDKYLQWADFLAVNTMKPVILFPIAFHMNRSPSSWTNPRIMRYWMEKRRSNFGESKALSFANVALSNRLSDEPYRFYNAGRQTMNDLVALARQLGEGRHPLFGEGAAFDIFGYSIGSFIAEILLMANPESLFTSSRLFIFCGGAIFQQMYGTSRYIMDEKAYERLLNYYCNEWFIGTEQDTDKVFPAADSIQRAFNSMISPDIFRDDRESFFNSRRDRISGISLQKDRVMPYRGVEDCMGTQTAKSCFEVIDFPFDYTHEAPFPINGKVNLHDLERSFLRVFHKGAAFLS